MPSKQKIKNQHELQSRIATLAVIALILLGFLYSLMSGSAAGSFVGFTVYPSSGSSSSSSSADTGGGGTTAPTGGGGTRQCERYPMIVSRRRVGKEIIETELPPAVARRVERCYVDEPAELHEAAPWYLDVPDDAWYGEAVKEFISRGILDSTQKYFRGNNAAKRAEVAKILTKLKGTDPEEPSATMIFDDVEREQWYTRFVEYAGRMKWLSGYGDCAGTHPCLVKPASDITRAESVAMIVRYFKLKPISSGEGGGAPFFEDVSPDAWYFRVIKTAADRCIVQGDPIRHLVRPGARVTRAELVTMLFRAEKKSVYGQDCSWGKKNAGIVDPPLSPASTSNEGQESPVTHPAANIKKPEEADLSSSLAPSFSEVKASSNSSVSSDSSVSSVSFVSSESANKNVLAPPETDMSGLIAVTTAVTGFMLFILLNKFLL
ncbi:hypothetical protein A3A67_05370 [Candidatus Peribacteria bacterium RIFCSPLOWO2_01_FULL_51_18]|nr:MAG: hypothetical protein A3A67_05370 [Candidatus Peribacteria bacterium RIFCSPLOWO2_01_FULL_51_18]